MSSGRNEESIRNLREAYASYKVYDHHYEEIGKVDDIFVDDHDQPEYIGVKMGFLGLKSTIVPISLVRVNDKRGLIEVARSKEIIKNAPSFDDDEEISPEHEAQILRHYGLDRTSSGQDYSYRGYSGGGYAGGTPEVDLEYGERDDASGPIHSDDERRREVAKGNTTSDTEPAERPAAREVRDDNEISVQRTEEELRAGVRQREAGSVNVRKRVRTDRERLRVPKRREEVTVERVPVEESRSTGSGDTPTAAESAEGAEGEIRIPIVEEEVVVEKKPVVKEEIRVRKNVVEEEEIVQEDVRKEEIEVEDETRRRDG